MDNGSNSECVELIERYREASPDVIKPILLPENTGTTYSRNRGLRESTGRYILILDSDAYIEAEALRGLMAFLDANPRTGIAAPKLLYESGNFQLSVDQFPTLLHKFARFLFLRKMESHSDGTETEARDVDYAISACWLIRRDAFEAAGYLDEKIFYSPEDVDYCLQTWEAGYRVTYVPSVSVVHAAQELSRGFRLSKFHFSHLGGLFYLFRKHRYFWSLKGLYRRIGR